LCSTTPVPGTTMPVPKSSKTLWMHDAAIPASSTTT
jgi:hypothetical protein